MKTINGKRQSMEWEKILPLKENYYVEGTKKFLKISPKAKESIKKWAYEMNSHGFNLAE